MDEYKSARLSATTRQWIRGILILSLVGAVGIFIYTLTRGESVSLVEAFIILGWMGWVVYMLWRSDLLKAGKARVDKAAGPQDDGAG